MVRLFHRDFGGAGKPPLVILHGLLGSSRNWQTVGADLAATYHVCALDLRNHGYSPHADEHDYDGMVADVVQWLDEQGMLQASVVGHSMGGKVAMALACRHPERVEALVVVDIAPRDYELRRHDKSFAAMNALDLSLIRSRQEAEEQLLAQVGDWALMKFLATNLDRDDSGRFAWRVNLQTLTDELDELGVTPVRPNDRYAGPALFVLGGKSWYVQPEDHGRIRAHFPQARIETIAGAGHNPHIEARAEFVAALQRFL